jgi:hypothetical protein
LRMLDLFCGRWGWSKAFAARGWECIGVDLELPPEIPKRCTFLRMDVLELGHHIAFKDFGSEWMQQWDFICASSPCEQYSVHGMKHFHPNPPYPELGIKLFEHTRRICEESGVPYVMENVRAAQQFVGNAVHHCGPFYLWGTGVPPLLTRGITKGIDIGSSKAVKNMTKEEKRAYRAQFIWNRAWSSSPPQRARNTAKAATIPPELANCVAEYAERLLEAKTCASKTDAESISTGR